jgi:ribose transport system substrate-binding protein
MKPVRLVVWAGAGLACLALAACNNQPRSGATAGTASSPVRVGFVSNNAHEFWTIADAGCRKAGQEFNAEVLFKRPANGTAAEQKDIVEDLLAHKIKALAISVNDPVNQKGFLDRIAERVPLITQDNDAPDSNRLCYLGTNNIEAGHAVGKLVKEAMPEGGTIAIFVGKPDPLNARERRQGVLDELAGQEKAAGPKYGKYTLLDTYYDYTDPKKAKDNAADALTKLRDQANVCLIGLWAYNPPAILSAVQDAGKQGKVKIVGFDEADNTLNGIKEGYVFGTVVQQPYEFGYQSVKLMAALAKGDRSGLPANGILYIPHRIIQRDNVLEFQQKLKELLHKQ